MNCETFDEVIKLAFSNYGSLNINVQLLSITDQKTPTPPGDWYSVTLEVEPVTADPHPPADTWYYGGKTRHKSGPVPLGIRPINKDQLVGCCEPAKKLPSGFPLAEASGELSWPLVPSVHQPLDQFYHGEASIAVNGELGCFVRELNAKTGYTWRFTPDNSGVYELVEEITFHPYTEAVGVPGMVIWKLKGVKAGKGAALFELYPLAATFPVETTAITITVE